VTAIRACAILGIADPDARAALDDPAGDCSLESLGFDSLSRLELAAHLDAVAGIQLSEEDVHRAGTIAGLTRLAAARL
jgi:acyl carrier protein